MTKMEAIAYICGRHYGCAVRDVDCLEAIRLIQIGCNPDRVIEVIDSVQDAMVGLDYFEANEEHYRREVSS